MSSGNWGSFTTKAASSAKREDKIKKIQENKEIRSEATGKKDTPSTEYAPGKRPVSKEQFEALVAADESSQSKTKRARKSTNTVASMLSPNDPSLDKKRTEAMHKYRAYWNSPWTRHLCSNVEPSESWSAEEAIAHVQRVRSTANRAGGFDWAAQGVKLMLWMVELGIENHFVPNPLDWKLRDSSGLGVSHYYVKALQEDKELRQITAEIGAELGLVAETNLAMRAATRFFSLIQGFSDSCKSSSSGFAAVKPNAVSFATAEPGMEK